MKQGVLLVNLGSPDSTKVSDVRKYLKEFLSDPKVIDVPFVRKVILPLIILPFRSPKSAKAYKKIWWEEGSPLIVLSERLQQKLAQQIDIPVALGMRYGKPSIEKAIKELHDQGVEEILHIPLYPQYAMSTTETVVDKVNEVQSNQFPHLKIHHLPPFYNHPDYVEVLAAIIKEKLPEEFDKLLFSYHGIPERHIYKTDKAGTCEIGKCCFQENLAGHATCYRHQCYQTTEAVKQKLGLEQKQVFQTFQSRLGRDPWLKPYTDKMLEQFPEKGVKKLAIVTPAFVSDCLETLEEIAMEGKEEFIEAGGETFTYIPCLNDDDRWIAVLKNWIHQWQENPTTHNP